MWNTKIISALTDDTIPVSLLNESPFFKGTKARKANLDFNYTPEEMEERAAARHIPPDEGQLKSWFDFQPKHFQAEILNGLLTNRFNIVHMGRQMGATTMFAVSAAANAAMGRKVLAIFPNGHMAEYFINTVKDFIVKMPFYMQPGVEAWNLRSISFEDCEVVTKDSKSLLKMPDLERFIKNFDLIIVDGADYIDDYKNLHARIMPIAMSQNQSFAVSTLSGDKQGILYNAAQEKSSFSYWRVPATQAFEKEYLENFRDMLGEENYNLEYSADFRENFYPAENRYEYKQSPKDSLDAPSPLKAQIDALASKEPSFNEQLSHLQHDLQGIHEAAPGTFPPVLVDFMLRLMEVLKNK